MTRRTRPVHRAGFCDCVLVSLEEIRSQVRRDCHKLDAGEPQGLGHLRGQDANLRQEQGKGGVIEAHDVAGGCG